MPSPVALIQEPVLKVHTRDQLRTQITIEMLHTLASAPAAMAGTDEAERQDKAMVMCRSLSGPWNTPKAPSVVLSLPGEGKLALFTEAAKTVSKGLGLNLLVNPSLDTPVTKDDFVLTVMEMEGMSSTTALGGPGAESRLIQRDMAQRFTTLKEAGGAALVLDGVANASLDVQNVLIPLTSRETLKATGLNRLYVGGTGNANGAMSDLLKENFNVVTMASPSMSMAPRVPKLADLQVEVLRNEITPSSDPLADAMRPRRLR